MKILTKKQVVILTIAFCASFVFTAAAYAQKVNIVQNPGFETAAWPPADWSEWQGSASGSPSDGVAGYISTSVSHSGSQSAVRELFGLGVRWGGYSQDVAVNEGTEVTARGWLRSDSSDNPLSGGAEAYIELKFFDVGYNELAAYTSSPLTGASPWVEHSIVQTAPAGTTIARLSFVLYASRRKSVGKAYFDDAALEIDDPDIIPPVVAITSPEDQSTSTVSPMTVTGTVDDATVGTIDVNGNIEPVTSGTWSSSVFLAEGANTIIATATDGAGNEGSDSITVYFNSPNLLLNPGFEDSAWPPVNWSEWSGAASGNPEDGSYGYIETAAVHSGLQSAARGLYGAGIRWGGYSQDLAINGWDIVKASCWLMSSLTDEPLADGAEAYIEIKFFDASDEELGFYKSAPLTGASAWVQHTLEKQAPLNAAKAALNLVIVGNADNATGKVYFDDASVKVVSDSYTPDIPFDKPQGTGAVQISGNDLLVDGSSFTIKGVCYQPAPVGSLPWQYDIYSDPGIYNRDLPILRDMGVNTVRTYSKVTSSAFLDACYNNGVDPIYVIMGFFINGESDLSTSGVRDAIKADFQSYVNTYRNHPAVLMWSPGNETEWAYKGCDYEHYTLLNELAEVAYIEEGSAYHPVTASLADIDDIGDGNLFTTDDEMDHLDVWGANVYRGITFGSLFDDYAAKSGKAFWVSEFGVDAWHTNDKYGDLADGYIDEASQEQYAVVLWDEIALRDDVCSGGTVFEYSDEWWKDDHGDPSIHEYQGFVYPEGITHPDQCSNEEWYGIVAVSDNGSAPDTISLRQAYYGLQSRWAGGEEPTIHIEDISMSLKYAGPNVSALATVTVYDADSQPIAGATVYGVWSGLTSDSDSGITDVSGRVTVESGKVRNPGSGSAYTFTVTDVVLNGYVYDQAANAETSDSILVP